MSEMRLKITVILVFFAGTLMGWSLHHGDHRGDQYRQGQIDCLNGKIQYERIVTADTIYTKR